MYLVGPRHHLLGLHSNLHARLIIVSMLYVTLFHMESWGQQNSLKSSAVLEAKCHLLVVATPEYG